MKTKINIFIFLFLTHYSPALFAGDVYAEYSMKGIGNRVSNTVLYFKNGDMRTEAKIDASGKEMKSFTLNLKSNPDFMLVFNSMTKTYTEVKKNNGGNKNGNVSITILGNEKIGEYNCKHVLMKSDSNNWEMWTTKDLSAFDFPLQSNDEQSNRNMMELLKSKSADGVPVKILFFSHKKETPTFTMELIKYENKTLDASLFTIPEGYTKSNTQFDPEKMKSMTPEEKREMIKKMMEEHMPKKE